MVGFASLDYHSQCDVIPHHCFTTHNGGYFTSSSTTIKRRSMWTSFKDSTIEFRKSCCCATFTILLD